MPLKANMNIQHIGVFSTFYWFQTLPLESSCVFVRPTGTASISLRPGRFQREASFSFTAGREQFNTHERSSGGEKAEDATRDGTKWHNISCLSIYNEDTWQINAE